MDSDLKSKLKAIFNRGQEAQSHNRQLDPIIEEMRQKVYIQIGKSKFHQKEEREEGYKMIRAIDMFQGVLYKRIQDGKMAKHKLK